MTEEQESAFREAAQETALRIDEVMKLYGQALKILMDARFSESVIHKAVQKGRQVYEQMLLDIPNLYRADLDADLQKSLADEAGE